MKGLKATQHMSQLQPAASAEAESKTWIPRDLRLTGHRVRQKLTPIHARQLPASEDFRLQLQHQQEHKRTRSPGLLPAQTTDVSNDVDAANPVKSFWRAAMFQAGHARSTVSLHITDHTLPITEVRIPWAQLR